MIYLRSFLFELSFYTWMTLLVLAACIGGIFYQPSPVACGRAWDWGTRLLLRVLCGISIEIRGHHNLPGGACIVASKHQSTLESVTFFRLLENPVFTMKAEVARLPLMGYSIRRAGSISVDRSAGASALRKLIKAAKEAFEKDAQVLIFPEGTRTQPRTRGKFNPGAAAIYSRCDVPVVPVALNTGSFWARRTLRKNPGRVIIEFLPPIEPGMERKAFQELLENTIEEATEKLELESPGPQSAVS
mgnify:FL=1